MLWMTASRTSRSPFASIATKMSSGPVRSVMNRSRGSPTFRSSDIEPDSAPRMKTYASMVDPPRTIDGPSSHPPAREGKPGACSSLLDVEELGREFVERCDVVQWEPLGDRLEHVPACVLHEHHPLAAQRVAERSPGEVRADGPVARIEERPQQRPVAPEGVAEDLRELVVPVGHERVRPIDHTGQPAVLD